MAELRKRNVVKAALAYIIIGWIIIEPVTAIFAAFAFPAWTTQFVILLVLLGFPITLVISWAFEITPEGLKPASATESAASTRPPNSHKLNYIIIGGLVLLLGIVLVSQFGVDAGNPNNAVDPTTANTQTSASATTATRPQPAVVTTSTAPTDIIPDSVAVLPFGMKFLSSSSVEVLVWFFNCLENR